MVRAITHHACIQTSFTRSVPTVFNTYEEGRWGAIPRLSSFPKLPTLPPELSPHRFTCRALATARVGRKRPCYALDRRGPFRATSGARGREIARLRTPNGGRSVLAVFADITADDVRRAAERLRGVIRQTELRRAPSLSARTHHDVWLKLENRSEERRVGKEDTCRSSAWQ